MTQQTVGQDLKQRAGRAIIAHAFFRIESAFTIALTILLAYFLRSPLPWWRWWYWLILGWMAEALIIYTSVTDDATAQRVVSEMLRERYEPSRLKTRRYRETVERALEYREQIERSVHASPPGVLREHLISNSAGVADWMSYIFDLARRLDLYERDQLLHRDLQELPANQERLLRELASESDPAVQEQIRAALQATVAQAESLRALERQMERARFLLEQSVAQLGTVYTQFQLIQAQRAGGAEARQLSQSIREQVQQLQDIISAMVQVYNAPAAP